MDGKPLIDVDDPATWPRATRKAAEQRAELLAGSTDLAPDLDLPLEEEDHFRRTLEGHKLLAFHATRLLPHEEAAIRTEGLRLASEDLVRRRVTAAYESGDITESLRDLLLAGNVFAENDSSGRADRISLFLSRGPLDAKPGGFHYLLSEWGGELITMSSGGSNLRSDLQRLGRPAIVSAAIDLSESWRTHAVYPSIQHIFVGKTLGLEDIGGSVHYRAPIPPRDIVDIWQPGHPEYARHADLPIL